jgi:hypothetical protein
MDRWHLNGIILSHVNRVFAAAAFVAREKADGDEARMVSLVGNLTWALSPYVTEDRSDEALMAIGGALAGTLGPSLIDDPVDAAYEDVENLVRRYHDQLVEFVWGTLVEVGLDKSGSFSAVNAHVWRVLFPQLRYEQSFRALARQISTL